MSKEFYQEPEAEIIKLCGDDIITTSSDDGVIELPVVPIR